MNVAGLLLAAGAGTRFGGPKALAAIDGRSFVTLAIDALVGGGCTSVHVVVGAAEHEVGAVLPTTVTIVRAQGWQDGMGESLRAGLDSLRDTAADAVVIHLVDLPDVNAAVVARLTDIASKSVLARAVYGGVIGHPVIVGRKWWTAMRSSVGEARGAREFLHGRALPIDCSDLASGADVDTPAELRRFAPLGRVETHGA